MGRIRNKPLPHYTFDRSVPFQPSINGKHCCFVVDSFSGYVQVYAVKSANTEENNKQMEKLTSFGIHKHLVHANGLAFMSSDFANCTFQFGIKLGPRTAYSH